MSAIRILAVDDEPDVEILLTQKFRSQIRNKEFAFEFAANGAAALERLRSGPAPEVVLLDINMPVMDGLTLLAHLALEDFEMRVVIVSAYGDMTNVRVAMNRGAFDFVTKPVDMIDLEATIRKSSAEVRRFQNLRTQREQAEKSRRNLARYFSPAVAAHLASRDDPFGPTRRQDVAILFADLVGFTGLSDSSPPEDVIELLREFHARMSAVVFAHGGIIEKYIGDALYAAFGVPDGTGMEAASALRCALAMLEKLAEWNQERAMRDEPWLQMGIGLNYGPAVLGDIGAEHSMAFAVVGNTVNLASRLQSYTRSMETALVASDSIVHAIRASAAPVDGLLRQLSERSVLQLRGSSRELVVWTNRLLFPLNGKAGQNV